MWRGARARRAPWEETPAPPPAPRSSFPTYDSVKVAQEDKRITVIRETRNGPPSAGSQSLTLVQTVQQAVNTARKSSNRVLKLKRDIELKDAQWSQYTKDIKASFAKEKERHALAISHLEQELQAAQEASQADQLAIQKAADRCFLSASGSEETDNNAAWNAMMAVDDTSEGVPSIPREVWEYMAHSARTMRESAMQGGTIPSEMLVPPGLASLPAPAPPPAPPVQRHVEAVLAAPAAPLPYSSAAAPDAPAYNALSPSIAKTGAVPFAGSSPLLHGPVPEQHMGPVETDQDAANPGPSDGGAARPAGHPSSGRAGVKDMTKKPPERPDVQGPSLGAKLDAKRAREPLVVPEGMGPAMRPFRGAGPPPPGGLGLPAETRTTPPGVSEEPAPEFHNISEEDGIFEVHGTEVFGSLGEPVPWTALQLSLAQFSLGESTDCWTVEPEYRGHCWSEANPLLCIGLPDALPPGFLFRFLSPFARSGVGCGHWLSRAVLAWFVLPVQVWAAPKQWGEAVDILIAAAVLFPEPLHVEPQAPDLMSDTDFAIRQSMIESRQASILDTSLHNAEDLPVPPLNDPEEDVEVAPAFTTGVFYVLAPHYQSEIVQMHLPSPCDLQTILNEARRGLNALKMRFSFRVLPTFPQLGSDYASLLVVPVWLDVTSMQVIVWDFRALGGPVYAAYCWNAVTYGDCIRESRRHGFHDWQAFVNSHSQALIQDASFVAVPGGVVQFQPPGAGPVWRGTLAARLDRPNSWSIDPDLPEIQVERPLLILHHEQVTLYTSRRFPVPGTRTFITSLVERTPDTALIVAPPGNFLTNVDYYGVTCRDVLAVYPLTPTPDRDCIIVFLDPRQTGNPLAHILLPERRVAPVALARFLNLRPPVCHKIAFWPRPEEDGMLALSEGDTVVFGYIDEAACSDDSSGSISDSSDDSDFDPGVGRGEGDGPSGSAGPDRGPPSAHEGGEASSRSRSPPGRFRGHALAQDPLSFAPLAVGTGLLLNTCPTAAYAPVPDPQTLLDGHCIFSLQSLAICCALGVVLWRVAATFPDIQRYASLGRARSPAKVRTCKLIEEPTGHNSQAQNRIDTLRSLASALGGPWLPRPFWRAGMLPPEDMVPEDSDEDLEPQICSIHCVVLKHTYCPESLTVDIPLPATQDELRLAVQHARTLQARERFPVLSPVLSQRGEGTAIFTARPVWGPGYCSVCLDTSAIDGRIFMAYTLEYASRAELIRIAHLPTNVVWGFDSIFPLSVVAGAYCLACRDGCHLFLADLWPQPMDVSLDGVPCVTALAVGDGWQTWYAYDGFVDIGALLHAFDRDAPLGWRTRLADNRQPWQQLRPVVLSQEPLANHLPTMCVTSSLPVGKHVEISGVPLLIACYVPPVRVLTVLAPANVSVDDILRLSGVEARDVHVYFSDQPWALRTQTVLAVAPGDLITIFPDGHPRIPPVALTRILASPEGWSDEPSPLGPYERQAWILTSHASHRIFLDDQSGLTLREVFANHVGAVSEANTVLPAVPALLDHEFQGIPSTQVFLAAPPSQVESMLQRSACHIDVDVLLAFAFGSLAALLRPVPLIMSGFGFHSVDFPRGDDDEEAHHPGRCGDWEYNFRLYCGTAVFLSKPFMKERVSITGMLRLCSTLISHGYKGPSFALFDALPGFVLSLALPPQFGFHALWVCSLSVFLVLICAKLHSASAFTAPSPLQRTDEFHRAAMQAIPRSPSPTEELVLTSDGSFRADTLAAGWGLVADEEDDAGTMLNDLLLGLDLCIPSTFASCMVGDGGTLFQKRNARLGLSRVFLLDMPAWTTLQQSCGAVFPPRGEVDVPAGRSAWTPKLYAPQWSTDVSEHAAVVVDYLYDALARHFPHKQRRLRASFFSEETSALHRAVAALRHAARARTQALRHTYLRCVWLAWRSPVDTFDSLFGGRWLWDLRTRLGHNCLLLRRFGRRLRATCKSDKVAHLSSLSDEVARAPYAEVHRAVQRVLRPRKYRKASSDPLPKLYKPDGSLCQTSQEVADTWREHFRILEGGIAVGAGELVRRLLACPHGKRLNQHSVIPPHGRRQVFHRSLRGLVVDHWSKNSMPLQVGGKTGLLFVDLQSAYYAVIRETVLGGVDLQSAYYAVIRETVLGGGLSDRPIEVVAGALGLDIEDLQLLRFYAEQEPILHQQNASPLLVSLARELHRQTWFVLAEDPKATIIETQRGTRPRGTLADVLFNVLFAKVRVTDIAYADDLCTPVVCQKARQEAFVQLKGRVPIWPDSKGLLWLDLVPRKEEIVRVQSDTTAETRNALPYACAVGPHVGGRNMAVGLPSAEALLHGERLRLLGQLVCSAPDHVWALVAWNQPFQAGLRAACDWLHSQVGAAVVPGTVVDNWQGWSAFILARPGHWKGLIRRAEGYDIERHHLPATLDRAIRASWEPVVPPPASPMADMEHACLLCGFAFCTRQQWGAHAQRKHGYRNTATKLAVGRQCGSCGTLFASQVAAQAPSLPEQTDLCLDLLAALERLESADDQEVYDLVASFVAPLPDLRRTLQTWVDSLPVGALRSAAEDVLLVLKPDLLCSQICGKVSEDQVGRSFDPRVVRPAYCPRSSAHPVLYMGSCDRNWLERWHLLHMPTERLDFDADDRSFGRCSGLCLAFPPPPQQERSFLHPGPLPLRALRLVNAWTSRLLSILPSALRVAAQGIPVLLRT
ncbi:unnamed protein product [Symbiodinium necroappetens]|uniref:C2H2-type domain-containing protein n=1 Tax=Symbiodinium necroappetens TaxID=1628268 RepID=A0A812Z986_9DINO|nr:unnamed protein product [Symbiodinium necroappetens]